MLFYDNLIWSPFLLVVFVLFLWSLVFFLLLTRAKDSCRKRQRALVSVDELLRSGSKVPVSLRRDTKAVLRRAVVFVFGDFARSPRMQYHAASLAKCGMFDEIFLLGFDLGNKLIGDLQDANNQMGDLSCTINTQYLIKSISLPAWFSFIFRGKNFYWFLSRLCTVLPCLTLFAWFFLRLSLFVVNKAGQLIVTDLFLFQLPPAIPFVPVFLYIVRPLAFILNTLYYYCVMLPAAWIMWDEMKDMCDGLKLQGQVAGEKHNFGARLRSVMRPACLVDWHNFGHTIIRSEQRPSFVVWLYRLFECGFCFGDRNITVSRAMRNAIIKYKGSNSKGNSGEKHLTCDDVVVLYDSSPSFFVPVSRSRFVREALLPAMRNNSTGIGEVIGLSPPSEWIMQAGTDARDDNSGVTQEKEGLFVVAATSWTPDDDYTVVVDALVGIEKRLREYQKNDKLSGRAKHVWLLVTGKGATREDFESAVKNANLSSFVTVTTIYFQQYKHYAMALGAADVGLCVHHSSSGLDLPMKAVDMLGSGLPVVALRTEAIGELLDDNNGWLFSNSKELENIFWQHLLPISEDGSEMGSLERKRLYLRENPGKKWDDRWNSVILPILRNLL